jgi:hypothetical protein
MGLTIENFKGIEFVRISSLPKDQQENVWQSFHRDKIIKILKDQALMNDCILYRDYAAWQSKQAPVSPPAGSSVPRSIAAPIGKLAFE